MRGRRAAGRSSGVRFRYDHHITRVFFMVSTFVRFRALSRFFLGVSQSRKAKLLSQKELAHRIKKEDGQPISAQYLNDI